MATGTSSSTTTKKSGRSVATKAMIIQNFKRRLKDNIKSLNDNFTHVIASAKINTDDAAHRNPTGRMTEFHALRNELATRGALMTRASDELLKLTHELREFLILHDFNHLSHSIESAEKEAKKNMDETINKYDIARCNLSSLILDMDQELSDNFGIRR